MTGEEAATGVLVTGGTSGIGRQIVTRLRASGRPVAFTGRDRGRGQQIAEATGGTFIATDVRDRDDLPRVVDEALSALGGGWGALVNNAAGVYEGPLEGMPESAIREVVEVNLTAAFRLSRAGVEIMRKAGRGSIVNIASDSALRGIHKLPAYSATKAGVLALSEVLAAEGAPLGIRVNAVCPGATHPGMRSTVSGFEHHAEDDTHWGPPLSARHGSADDVAKVVEWLLSDDAEHVSGATLRVDGGSAAARTRISVG